MEREYRPPVPEIPAEFIEERQRTSASHPELPEDAKTLSVGTVLLAVGTGIAIILLALVLRGVVRGRPAGAHSASGPAITAMERA